MNNNYKEMLNAEFEYDFMKEKFEELDDVDDLWYFIRSSAGAWIVGSVK